LLEWRKAWANANNAMLERKGLDIRIDHRTYKEQGIDRLPFIHMGHAATALERKGIETERGNYNREIQLRNDVKDLRATLMRANETVRQYLESEKTAQNKEKTDAQRRPEIITAGVENELSEAEILPDMAANEEQPKYESHIDLELERVSLRAECNGDEREILKLELHTEDADERVENAVALQVKGEELTTEHKKMRFWQIGRKRWINGEIRQIEREIRETQRYFEAKYKIAFDDAPAEIERVKKELGLKRSGLERKKARLEEIEQKLDALDPNRALMRRVYIAPELIRETLTKMRQRPKKQAPDMSRITQLIRSLDADAIPEDDFREIIAGLEKIQKLNLTKRKTVPR
jgi:hypothetical protein